MKAGEEKRGGGKLRRLKGERERQGEGGDER